MTVTSYWTIQALLHLCSGCYSPALSCGLAMANLPVNLAVPGTELEVMLAGEARAATVLPGPPLQTQPARERTGPAGQDKVDLQMTA